MKIDGIRATIGGERAEKDKDADRLGGREGERAATEGGGGRGAAKDDGKSCGGGNWIERWLAMMSANDSKNR